MFIQQPFNLTGAAAGGAAGYVPKGAIWLDGTADFLARENDGTATSDKTFTVSYWFKNANPDFSSNDNYFHWGGTSNVPQDNPTTLSGEYLTGGIGAGAEYGVPEYTITYNGGTLYSNAKYRDPTAWQHFVCIIDSANASSASRNLVYHNGTLISWESGTDIPLDKQFLYMQDNKYQYWGIWGYFNDTETYTPGYFSQCALVDGLALGPENFGTEDSNGVWIPKTLTGLTFGHYGHWLDFSDSSDLGKDVSGKANHFTSYSMSSSNWTYDRPADDSAITTGNYCTWNNLLPDPSSDNTFSNGNRTVATSSSSTGTTQGTIGVTSGHWYWEQTPSAIASAISTGVLAGQNTSGDADWVGKNTFGIGLYSNDGGIYYNSVQQSTPGTYGVGDVIGVELNLDAATPIITFTKDGSAHGSFNLPVNFTSGDYLIFPGTSAADTDVMTATLNTGADGFTHTIPTGAKALGTQNLPAPTVTTPGDYFKTVLYEGDGVDIGAGGLEVTGVGFEPDFVWIGGTDSTSDPVLCDIVQGEGYRLITSETGASLAAAEMLSTFDSDGFTLGDNSNINTDTKNYVAWCMKAGGAATTTSPAGTIASTSSVADHGGFSIVKYDPGSGGSPGDTVGHGLSVIPSMIIVKAMEAVGDQNWFVYHEALTATNVIILNTSGATSASDNYWNDTEPTDEVFSIGSDTDNDTAYIAYCFARTPGLIGIGSYTANNVADGPYIIANDGASGFRPAYIMFKNTESEGYAWSVIDTARNTYNPSNTIMSINNTSSEWGNATSNVNFTSNGFKVAGTAGETNYSTDVIIYLAFAENPFGGSGVGQSRAR